MFVIYDRIIINHKEKRPKYFEIIAYYNDCQFIVTEKILQNKILIHIFAVSLSETP